MAEPATRKNDWLGVSRERQADAMVERMRDANAIPAVVNGVFAPSAAQLAQQKADAWLDDVVDAAADQLSRESISWRVRANRQTAAAALLTTPLEPRVDRKAYFLAMTAAERKQAHRQLFEDGFSADHPVVEALIDAQVEAGDPE